VTGTQGDDSSVEEPSGYSLFPSKLRSMSPLRNPTYTARFTSIDL
jgi:hypothetical protein